MTLTNFAKMVMDRFLMQWFACRITSGRKSARYGLRFSYPLYTSLVALGVLLANPFILSITSGIAFLGILLPMHPFDYAYNKVAKLLRTDQIPGRGTELQVNSSVALLFNLAAIALMLYEIQLNYVVMAMLYIASSIFFIAVQLRSGDISK